MFNVFYYEEWLPITKHKSDFNGDFKILIISFKNKSFNFRGSSNNYEINVVNNSFFKLPRCSLMTRVCLVMDVFNLILYFLWFFIKQLFWWHRRIFPYGWHIIHLMALIPCTSLVNSSSLITKNVNATYSNQIETIIYMEIKIRHVAYQL